MSLTDQIFYRAAGSTQRDVNTLTENGLPDARQDALWSRSLSQSRACTGSLLECQATEPMTMLASLCYV